MEPDRELEFLHPLPVDRLWGVGRVTATKLADRGIHSVRDVALLPAPVVMAIVGRAVGHQLHALSHNRDPRRVEVGRRRGSIGSQQALGRRRRSHDDVATILRRIVDRITRRMRVAERVGRTVTLRLRFDDFSRATRARSLRHATASSERVHHVAQRLLADAWEMIEERGITLVGVSVGNLTDADAVQLTLPFERSEAEALEEAVDAVRDRFGSRALNRVAGLGSDPGFSIPMLPD